MKILALTLLASLPSFASADVVSNSCAPWDGPAIAVSIGKKFPKISVLIYRDLPMGPGASYVFSEANSLDKGNARYCVSDGKCELPEESKITFTEFKQGKAAKGTYELKLKSGKKVKGKFDAGWDPRPALCG